jgi:hypothetical protein
VSSCLFSFASSLLSNPLRQKLWTINTIGIWTGHWVPWRNASP